MLQRHTISFVIRNKETIVRISYSILSSGNPECVCVSGDGGGGGVEGRQVFIMFSVLYNIQCTCSLKLFFSLITFVKFIHGYLSHRCYVF